ncbi:MAG TPA: maleylpyruvate isomerase N-terminal domain-containing protein, partial [Candidatus Limnocylindrales bacterium]|nr:maleylpyruvate isomerase N-terminal domain-containing protein [Candidatus Limnocylindrales bacterium]
MDEGVGSPTITWHAAEAFAAEVEVERARWMAISALVESLTDNERRAPGYFRDPDWSVKDLVAHLTAWMAEARVQLLDIAARSYVPHEIAVDARNARILELSKAQTWDETWAAANAA